MTLPDLRSDFWRGFGHALPFVVVVLPFGMVFGIAATEAGMTLAELIAMTIIVFAGASQFAALQLMIDNAPTLVVLATSLAVNLRLAMYSAALAPHLGAAPQRTRALIAYFLTDQPYALSVRHYERHPDAPIRDKIAYFFGTALVICPVWFCATLAGAVFGAVIPPEYALNFAVPIAFIALIAPMLPTLAHMITALVSVALTLALAFLPNGIGLLIAAAIAMVAGARVELWTTRRQAR